MGPRLLVSLLLVWLLRSVWGNTLGPTRAEAQAAPSELDRLIEEALENNPDIAAALARWDAAREQPAQAGSLPDPELMAQVIRFRDRGLGVRSEGETWYSLRQELPFPGKLGLRERIARYEADRAGRDYETLRLDLVEAVRLAYYHLLHADLLSRATAENRSLVERTMEIARARYEVGSSEQQEWLLARVERARIANELAELGRMRADAAAELDALVARPVSAGLALAGASAPSGALQESRQPLDVDSLVALALTQRPELAETRLSAGRDTLALRLARKAYLPDFFVGAEYWVGEGDNPSSLPDERYVLDIGLSVPWIWKGKHDAGVREARAQLRASRYDFDQTVNRIRREVAAAVADVRSVEQQVSNFESTILPEALLSLESSTEAYQTDRVGFLTLVDAQRTLNELQIAYHATHVELLLARARLLRALGEPPADGHGRTLEAAFMEASLAEAERGQ